ncbi:MAG: hypothetical protein KA314_14245 [Chloroflexi bacterium]|nr:hypothetical protein [Chloroflexota bacterium]MBP8056994.1 hypothetical protein [Chloroflexota bacterium]
MAGLGINWQKQKALLVLRGRLTLRQYTKEPGRILSAILAALFLLPLVLGAAVGTGAAYLLLPEPWPGQVLGVALVIMWFIWFSLPLFSFNVNEGLDPTRLIVYPISRRDFVVTLFAGTLFDYPTYFMLPLFMAALIGWGVRFPFTLPVLFISLLLNYMVMVLTSQLVVNIIGGLLQSRRFRDVMIIIFSLVGSSCWFVSQACNRLTEQFSGAVTEGQAMELQQTLTSLRPLTVLQWLPPGAAAKAVEQASVGAWGEAILWLLYTLFWVIVLTWGWWRVLQRIVTGEGFLINLGKTAVRAEKATSSSTERDWLAWLPPEIGQMALKELKAIWRIPQRRVAFIQGLIMPFVLIIIFGAQGGDSSGPDNSRFSVAFLPFYALFTFWANGQNMLGLEMTGLTTLLMTPVSRQYILLGKTLGLGVVSGLPLLLLGTVLTILQGDMLILLFIPAALGLGLMVLGVMSVSSVYIAFPTQFERKTGQNAFSGGGGCVPAIASLFAVPAVIALLSLPVAAPLAIGLLSDLSWLVIVGAVVSVFYGPLVLWLGTYLGGRALQTREPELLQATRPQGT